MPEDDADLPAALAEIGRCSAHQRPSVSLNSKTTYNAR